MNVPLEKSGASDNLKLETLRPEKRPMETSPNLSDFDVGHCIADGGVERRHPRFPPEKVKALIEKAGGNPTSSRG